MARTKININTLAAVFIEKLIPHSTHEWDSHCTASDSVSQNGAIQPPGGKSVEIVLIIKILPYSAMNSSAENTGEYSTLYPATDSASASTRSNGVLLVSANEVITNSTHIGNDGMTNQTSN